MEKGETVLLPNQNWTKTNNRLTELQLTAGECYEARDGRIRPAVKSCNSISGDSWVQRREMFHYI